MKLILFNYGDGIVEVHNLTKKHSKDSESMETFIVDVLGYNLDETDYMCVEDLTIKVF